MAGYRFSVCLLLILILSFAGPVLAGEETVMKEFNTLVEKAKMSDTTLDFQALRMAYAKTPYYSPYGNRLNFKELFTLLKQKKYRQILEKTTPMLPMEFVNIDLHFLRMEAYQGIGDKEMQNWHDYMTFGLIDSIVDSGDGKSPETAFHVIYIHEEYIVLSYLGFQPLGQSLVDIDGHSYDLMEAKSETGETVKLYFNVDLPLRWLNEQFRQ